MPTLVVSRRALADLERFVDHSGAASASDLLDLVFGALAALRRHPYLGRPARHDLRELIISRGSSGYVALYEYQRARDEVVVHALRHQREAGYAPE